MASIASVNLTGRVLKEGDVYVVVVDKSEWTTHSDSFEGVLNEIPGMVRDYLQGYAAKGKLEPYLQRLGHAGPVPDTIDIVLHLDVSEAVSSAVEHTQRVTFPLDQAA